MKLLRLLSMLIVIGACAATNSTTKEKDKGPVLGDEDDIPSDRNSKSLAYDDGEEDDGVQIEGAKGYLGMQDVRTVVTRHWPAINRCFITQSRMTRYVGGAVEMQFFVDPKGRVIKVFNRGSTLGSWTVENCILKEAQTMVFPKPGGTGTDFTLPIDFPPYEKTTTWMPGQIQEQLKLFKKGLLKCKPRPKEAKITFYVESGGTIAQAGFSAKELIKEAWVACVNQQLTTLTLEDPKGVVAKVSFDLRR